MPELHLHPHMLELQAFMGFDALALALIAITLLIIGVLLVKVAVKIAIRAAIVAAIVFGVLYALNLTLNFNPLGLPGTLLVDILTLLG
jgi:hypothetical protein